jgi:hypothetical protein
LSTTLTAWSSAGRFTQKADKDTTDVAPAARGQRKLKSTVCRELTPKLIAKPFSRKKEITTKKE